MSITGGVSWEEVLGPLKAINAFWVVLFLFYICFTHFAVLNVLTAVFCQSAIDGAQNDHASKVHAVLANKQVHLDKIHELFAKFGAENGVITFNMFQQKINAPEVRDWVCHCFFCGIVLVFAWAMRSADPVVVSSLVYYQGVAATFSRFQTVFGFQVEHTCLV